MRVTVTVDYLLMVQFPLRLGNGGNDRKHWRAADRQKTAEKEATAWALAGKVKPPAFPVVVRITRIAPGNGLDSDNNVQACKYIRDAVAKWIGIDDRDETDVRYVYAQECGPWGVRIQMRAAT